MHETWRYNASKSVQHVGRTLLGATLLVVFQHYFGQCRVMLKDVGSGLTLSKMSSPTMLDNVGIIWTDRNRNFHRNKRTSCSKIIRFIVITALTTGLTLTLTLTYCITECSFRLPAVFLELNLKIIHCFALFWLIHNKVFLIKLCSSHLYILFWGLQPFRVLKLLLINQKREIIL